MKTPLSTTLWNFVPMMSVMPNECMQGLRSIHEVYTLFQDRRGETEPKGSLGTEQNSSNQYQILHDIDIHFVNFLVHICIG